MNENILKINNDYFDISNISNLDNYLILIFKNFVYRSIMPIELTNIKYWNFESKLIKINYEDIENLIKMDQIQINFDTTYNGNNIQIFSNIAIKIPNIFRHNENLKNKCHILNSINLKEIYEHIFKISKFQKDKYIFVYTKDYYLSKKNMDSDYNKLCLKNYLCIIPQINIYYDYEKVENKYLCELSGTVIR